MSELKIMIILMHYGSCNGAKFKNFCLHQHLLSRSQATQAHVSSKSQRLVHECVTRCVWLLDQDNRLRRGVSVGMGQVLYINRPYHSRYVAVERKLTSYPSLFRGRVQSDCLEHSQRGANLEMQVENARFRRNARGVWYWDKSQGEIISDCKL